MRLETLLVHAGHAPDPATGAVSPPIHLSTNFAREPDNSLPHGYLYARSENPNRVALERALAPLEGGAVALTFASGMAATTAVFQSLQSGDHVIVPADAYYGTAKVLREVFARWGLASSFVDMTDPGTVERALTPRTRLLWVETPSNPALAVTDIAAICRVGHAAGALVVCDNTWATPLLQRPIELGADVVMHATTKYLAGHGDVTGGALVLREEGELAARLRTVQTVGGAVPSPLDCWLVHRGMRTMAHRMRGHCDNAERVAEFLAGHPAVEIGALSRAGERPRPRGRGSPDAALRRDGLGAGPRRRGSRPGRGLPRQALHPGHQPGRPGEPDRAPGIGRRTRQHHAAGSVADVGWTGAPG